MADEKKIRYLRNIKDGTIHEWNQWLDGHKKLVEVSEEEAYPERFVKGGARKAKVDMTTEEPKEPENEANKTSGEQAGKQLGKKLG